MKYLWTLACLAIMMVNHGCDNSEFSGSTSKKAKPKPKPEKTAQNEEQVAEEVQEAPAEPPPAPEPVSEPVKAEADASSVGDLVKVVKEIHAGNLLELNLLEEIKSPSSDLGFGPDQTFPKRFKLEQGKMGFQSDLQDIGREYSLVLDDLNHEIQGVHLNIKVLPPKVERKACFREPNSVIGDIAPEEMWHWKGWGEFSRTYSSPAAADLNQDGTVEIVSIPSKHNDYNSGDGPIVVLEGKTGKVIWNSIEKMNIGGKVSSTPALFDIDNDGTVEILTTQSLPANKAKIVAIDMFANKIEFEFSHDNFECFGHGCMVTAADLDGDDKVEIIAGNVVLNADGTLKHLLPYASYHPQVASVGELKKDSPGLEIAIGTHIFSSKGDLLWSNSTCNGRCFTAISDLDKNGQNELVLVTGGKVYAYDGASGNALWNYIIPGGGNGGAPNIGDFNGDGNFEIGTAGGTFYVVVDRNGKQLWQSKSQDLSSSSTGSTIFDFNGDGKVEVIYNDEVMLRIYDGSTGDILWETVNNSGTLWEYPLVLNIDEDPSVEIVLSAPGFSQAHGGVRAFKDPTGKWVSSRRLWNQYSYYPELVSDNLRPGANSSEMKFGYRVNMQGNIVKDGKISLPDGKIHGPLFWNEGEDALTFFIANEGDAILPKGTVVSIRGIEAKSTVKSFNLDGDLKPGEGKSMTISGLSHEQYDKVKLEATVNLNDSGTIIHQECRPENNKTGISAKLVP